MKTYQLIIVVLAALFAGTVPPKSQAGTPCPPSRSQCRSEAEYIHRCREYQQYLDYQRQERLRYEAYMRQIQYQQQARCQQQVPYYPSCSSGYGYGAYPSGCGQPYSSGCRSYQPVVRIYVPRILSLFGCR